MRKFMDFTLIRLRDVRYWSSNQSIYIITHNTNYNIYTLINYFLYLYEKSNDNQLFFDLFQNL